MTNTVLQFTRTRNEHPDTAPHGGGDTAPGAESAAALVAELTRQLHESRAR